MPNSFEPSQPVPAAALYSKRLAECQATEAALHREHLRIGYVRLAFGVAMAVLLFPPVPWILLPLAGFLLAAHAHQGVLRRLAATRRLIAFHQRGLARLADRWAGENPREIRRDLVASLYAADLDLFGQGSLFELLCEARTTLGEDTLADWLLAPGPVPRLLDRHAAIDDLRGRAALRENFAAAAGPALAKLDRDALAAWGEAPPTPLPGALRWLAPLLVALTAAAAWRFAAAHSPILLILALAVDTGLTFACAKTCKALFAEAERAQRALATAAVLLGHFEAENVTAPRLLHLQQILSASAPLRQLANLAQWAEARGNYIVRILDAPLLYSLQLALRLERWRARNGPRLASWLDALGEVEALLSLAAYSFEHPEQPFPQLVFGPPAFVATGLGHPLLPATRCVRNDVRLDPQTHMLLVSGSNMSGKSTLLRAAGINAVLAFAGAPVCAASLTLSPLTVAASIRVNDSLQDGRSRFYAEILRLRAVAEAARTRPHVLFLLDELLAGTNSSDRLAGARGLVRDLLSAGALGLLSTHDLALTSLALGNASIRNVHFQDEFLDGDLRFDHTLRDGVVERSNGLALMRMIGLNV